MAEKRKTAPAPEDERPVKASARPWRLGWRILMAFLLVLLIGGTAFLLYNGSISKAAIQALEADNESQRQSIASLTAGRDLKDQQIQALSEESAEKDRQLQALADEVAEKDRQLQGLSAENGEKAGQLAELKTRLSAANAPLNYQAALRESVPAAALQALELPEGLEQSEEMKSSLLAALFRTAYLEADPDSSREDRLCFTVHASDGQLLGSVAFAPAGTGEDGTPLWTAAEERFDFSRCFRTTSVTVPPDYTVYLGEQLLSPLCASWTSRAGSCRRKTCGKSASGTAARQRSGRRSRPSCRTLWSSICASPRTSRNPPGITTISSSPWSASTALWPCA